jgi:hypothetical protein
MITAPFLHCGLILLAGLGFVLSLQIGSTRRGEEKSVALLRSWLTPEQAAQWDRRKEFDVVGSDTGTRYCIRCGTVQNINELNSNGKVVARWCFIPQGNLAVGDVMLAQKIALETMERRALSKANKVTSPFWFATAS